MPEHYEYNFVEASPTYAKIKEEMKSYFDTGAVDDLLFPIWTRTALSHLGKGSFPIYESILFLEDYEAKLPPDFISVREAWLCTRTEGDIYRFPGSYYKMVTTRISNEHTTAAPCNPECDPCADKIEIMYKTTTETVVNSFLRSYLLVPGNISTRTMCDDRCPNLLSRNVNYHTFDIKRNKFVTSFREGEVYLKYYSKELDEEGSHLLPDNVHIIGYVEAYIKYKLYEALWNQVTDETFNQIERKYQKYEQQMWEALSTAKTEAKKKTAYQIADDIRRTESRHNKFNIR